MVVRGAESSLHTGLEVDRFHFGRVENRIRVGPNEAKFVATESSEFGFCPSEESRGFRLLCSVVVEPGASVVVDGEETIALVSYGPGEHARVIHMNAFSGFVVMPSEVSMSVFVRMGLDFGGQTVRAFAVLGGYSGEVNFVSGSNTERCEVEMAQFCMPPFPRVLPNLEFATPHTGGLIASRCAGAALRRF